MKHLVIIILLLAVFTGIAIVVAEEAAEGPAPPPPPPEVAANPNGPPAAVTMLDLSASSFADSLTVKWKVDIKAKPDPVAGWIVEYAAPSSIAGQMASHWKIVDKTKREATISGFLMGRVYRIVVMPYGPTEKGEMRTIPMKDALKFSIRTGMPAKTLHAPQKLTAVADGTRVLVSWEPTPDSNAAGYEIYRRSSKDPQMKFYAILRIDENQPSPVTADLKKPLTPAGPSAFIDSGLEPNEVYEYAVRTYSDDREPKYSQSSAAASVATRPFVPTSQSVLIVINSLAKGSKDIALHYRTARRLDKPAGIQVTVPVGPEISRADYETRLLKPIREYISAHPEVTNILLVRGIPWRITESVEGVPSKLYGGWDRASVDSELTLARFDDYPLQGRIYNPLFGKSAHITPVDRIIAVTRLDGPDDKQANALVDRAIDAEKRGIEGIAFFDARGLKTGAYVPGDLAIRKAADLMEKDGRMKVELEDTAENIDLSTKTEKIGFYYGWYKSSWQPKNKAFRFGRGAIGAHLHSDAGYTIAADKQWVGEMIDHGATAVLGVATEPLLDGFPASDALVDALLKGCTFGEAALSSSRYLSWMPVAIGDPLYRPFKEKPKDAKPVENAPAVPAPGAAGK